MKGINNIVTDMQSDREIKARLDAMNYSLGKTCVICGEHVKLSEIELYQLRNGHCIHDKICDKCKAAIRYVRNNFMEE